MAAPIRITREAVLTAALELVREKGSEALNARGLAAAMGCSTQPIFRAYPSMELLRRALLVRALEFYHDFLDAAAAASGDPPYKARGMAYIRFAQEEPRLFRMLFMRSRSDETDSPENPDFPRDAALAGDNAGLRGAEAERFHLEMWALVHGVAAMLATGYLPLEEETVSRMLSDVFHALKQQNDSAAAQKRHSAQTEECS